MCVGRDNKMYLLSFYFLKEENVKFESSEINLVKSISDESIGDWIEDSRRVYSQKFKNGIKTIRYQMIRLVDNSHMQVSYIKFTYN